MPTHTPHPQTPFLPTVTPEIHFPQDDIADYDQNNIHRPVNAIPPGLPPGVHIPNNYGDANKKLTVISLQADSPTSVMMLFGLPPVLVGLRGSVDLRYTDKAWVSFGKNLLLLVLLLVVDVQWRDIGSHSEGLPSLPIELLQAQYRKFRKLKNEDNFRVIPRDLINRGSY